MTFLAVQIASNTVVDKGRKNREEVHESVVTSQVSSCIRMDVRGQGPRLVSCK